VVKVAVGSVRCGDTGHVAGTSRWGLTPRQSIERECGRRGKSAVVAGCRALVRGDQVDARLLLALGGPGAQKFLDGQPHPDTYWLRVWGLRGLLWAWDDAALPELCLALRDDAWRVREMAFKVISRNLLGDFTPEAAAGGEDAVARVREAALRALTQLTASGA
jgi:hypothetical protein